MPSINVEKCYVLDEGVSEIIPDVLLPDNWLEKLSHACAQALSFSNEDSQTLQERVIFHVGVNSTYALKAELLRGLRVVYQRLVSIEEHALNVSLTMAIASKIQEGALNCTPGFHDRINDIVNGFFIPKSITALLYHLRKSIIETVARKNTDEVHAHNRFFIDALGLGYGVKPPNPNDIYPGLLTVDIITKKLKEAFETHYSPLAILVALTENIKIVLHTQFEYTGAREKGYTYSQYGKCVDYLKLLFGEDAFQSDEYLILNEAEDVTDINWRKIKHSLFATMVRETFIEFSELEFAVVDRVLHEPPINNLLLTDVEVKSLLHTINSPSITPSSLYDSVNFLIPDNIQIHYQLITTYIQTLLLHNRLNKVFEFCQLPHLNPNLYALLTLFVVDKRLDTNCDNFDNFSIKKALENKNYKKFNHILTFLDVFPIEKQEEILLGNNTLMDNTFVDHPQLVELYLKAISKLPQDRRETIWKKSGGQVILLNALKNDTLVSLLLDFISTLSPKTQDVILLKNYGNLSLIHYLERCQPGSIGCIIQVIHIIGKLEPAAHNCLLEKISGLAFHNQMKLVLHAGDTFLQLVQKQGLGLSSPIFNAIRAMPSGYWANTDIYNALLQSTCYWNQGVSELIFIEMSQLPSERLLRLLRTQDGHAYPPAFFNNLDLISPILKRLHTYPLEDAKHIAKIMKNRLNTLDCDALFLNQQKQFKLNKFFLHLAELREKIAVFKQRPYAESNRDSSYHVALSLYNALTENVSHYHNGYQAHIIFRMECVKAIKAARPNLSNHRGLMESSMVKIAASLGFVLATLTGVTAAKTIYERTHGKKSYGFFSPLKNGVSQALDEMEMNINAL